MLREYVSISALAVLFLLSALGWGDLLSKALRRPKDSFWPEITAQFVVGSGALYLVFVGLSLFSRLHSLEVIIVLLLGLVASCLSLFGTGTAAATAVSGLRTWSVTDLSLLIAIGILALLQLLVGLTPLVFYDTQVYHLFVPSQFLMSGEMAPTPWNVHANSPLALQFTVGMSLAIDRSGQVAKLLITIIACLLAVGTYELIKPVGRRAALLATICVLSYPDFWVMQTFGVIDLAVAGLMLLGIVWARKALRGEGRHHGILAGLAFGFAVGSRYQAVILLSWALLVVIGEAFLRQPRPPLKKFLGLVLAVGCLTATMAAPWLVRNYVHLGNPVFPVMASVWGTGGEWSPAQADLLNAEIFGTPIFDLPFSKAILAPVNPFMDLGANGFLGPVLLLGCLLGVAASKRDTRIVCLLGLGGLILWSLLRPAGGVPYIRFNALSVGLALAAIGALLGGTWIPRAGTGIALVLSGGTFVVAVFHVHTIFPAAQTLVYPGTRQAMRQAYLPSWEAFDYVKEKLDPAHHKLFLIGETRGFELPVPAIVPSAFNGKQVTDFFGGDSEPKAWREGLSRMGVTHLLLSPSEIERVRDQYSYLKLSPEQFEKFRRWTIGLTPIFQDSRGTVVLALAEPPAPGK